MDGFAGTLIEGSGTGDVAPDATEAGHGHGGGDVTEAAPVTATALAALARAQDYARASRAAATQRAYRSDWQHFAGWCQDNGLAPLPAAPAAVGAYLAAHAESLSPATLTRRLSAVAVAHRLAGHGLDTRHPAIRDVLAGIRRARGVAPRRAAPATTDIVRRMVAACDTGTLIGRRDAALVLVGFGAALRRSELAGLDRRDVAITAEGARVTLRRSKADQEGKGEVIGIARLPGSPTCPVAALEAWLAAAGITTGPIYRAVNRHGHVAATALNDRAVARIVQKLVEAIGLDATTFAGHSLRAGFATAAARAGVEERRIAKHTRHRSAVIRIYIRDGALFRDNASREVGL